jgi:hypothetical protein
MNKALVNGCLVFLIVGIAFPLQARPPFEYDSALDWADQTVDTQIPKSNRIYVLGPEKVTEIYMSNGLPASHQVETRKAFPYTPSTTLESIIRPETLKNGEKLWLAVYRAGKDPIVPFISLMVSDTTSLEAFQMQPRDIVVLSFPPPSDEKPTVVL